MPNFVNDYGLPAFTEINAGNIVEVMEKKIAETKKTIEDLVASDEHPTWENFVEPIFEADDILDRTYSPIRHMSSTVTSDEFREAYNQIPPMLSAFSTWYGQNVDLYEKYKKIGFPKNNTFTERSRSVELTKRGFELSGVALSDDKKARLAEINEELSNLKTTYENNALDATESYLKVVDCVEDIEGLPEDAIKAAAKLAEEKGKKGCYAFSLHAPSIMPLFTHCENDTLREEINKAYVSRASDVGPDAGKFDNLPIMNRMLELKQERAEILGFKSIAEQSVFTKMADSPEEAIEFLRKIAAAARPFAEKEYAEIQAYSVEKLGRHAEPWDIGFISNKIKEMKYDFTDEETRDYFDVDRVLKGMFDITEKLFGVKIFEREMETYHEDVRFFEIYRHEEARWKGHYGGGLRLIGAFYLDLYAREGKRGGAWMDECIIRRWKPADRKTYDGKEATQKILIETEEDILKHFGQPMTTEEELASLNTALSMVGMPMFVVPVDDEDHASQKDMSDNIDIANGNKQLQLPVAYLTCNFTPPIDGVSKLRHSEVTTLFHEFGHGLHHMLTTQTIPNISGINGVEWDAVELPSQMMENWCWDKESVALFSDIPEELMDRMLSAKNYGMGLATLRQIEFGLFDLLLHHEGGDIYETLNKVREEVAVVPAVDENRFANTFSHIFAGGYTAGYFSYLWSLCHSDDAFTRFQNEGVLNDETGRDFLSKLLSQGGRKPARELFEDFMGRELDINSYLKNHGLLS